MEGKSPLASRSSRAKARLWAKFADDKCGSNVRNAYISRVKEQEKAMEEAFEALKVLEEEIIGKEFFGGKSAGLVDSGVGWFPYWLPALEAAGGFKLLDAIGGFRGGLDSAFPSLHPWGERCLNLPRIKNKLPSSDEMLARFTSIRMHILNN